MTTVFIDGRRIEIRDKDFGFCWDYDSSDLLEFIEDEFNYIITLKYPIPNLNDFECDHELHKITLSKKDTKLIRKEYMAYDPKLDPRNKEINEILKKYGNDECKVGV